MVDAGDVLAAGEPARRQKSAKVLEGEQRAELILAGMLSMGYDAMTLGENDLAAPDIIANAVANGLPVVSANVRYPEGQGPSIVPYVLKAAGGGQVAITGVLGASALRQHPPAQEPGGMPLPTIEDEVIALRALMPEMRSQADLVIVLAHTGNEPARDLAEQVPGIDVMVVGHGGTMSPSPIRSGGAYLAQAGRNGENMGDLAVTFGPAGNPSASRVKEVTGKVTAITKDLADEPAVKAMVDAFIASGQPAAAEH